MSAVVSGAYGVFNANPWTVISNAWNVPNLVHGVDYTQSLTYNPLNPNEDVQASWSFPQLSGPDLVVLSYPALEYGASPWNPSIQASESNLPIKLTDISTLTFNYDVEIGGQTGGFNIAFDIWLTNAPTGDGSHVTHEIMLWLHTGDGGPAGNVIGPYNDDLFGGTAYMASWVDAGGTNQHGWRYIALEAPQDHLTGQIDFKAMLDTMKSFGFITGNEYLVDIELGAEITYGSGSFNLNYLDINLNGAGDHLQMEDSALRGTARADELYLYGQRTPGAGADLTDTYDTPISFEISGTIINGAAPSVQVVANGQTLGSFQLTATPGGWVDSYGIAWSAKETITVKAAGLNDLSDLKLVFNGSADVGGPENMTTHVSKVTVGGIALTDASYTPGTGGFTQAQTITGGVVQWNGGQTSFDTDPWSDALAARTTGAASNPIMVTGGDGDDVLHVLGTASQYQITDRPDGGILISESSGLGQNAILKSIETLIFQDGARVSLSPVLQGTAAGEVLNGSQRIREIHGGDGADTINGVGDGSILLGDGGHDVINGGSGFDEVNGNIGNDTIHGGGGADWLYGGQGDDQVFGDAGNDFIWGDLGNDTLSGGDGNDQFRGGDGNDSISGGAGNDYLSGDAGNDTLSGGAGADIFHAARDGSTDWITDFNAGDGDRLLLDPGTRYAVAQQGADTVLTMAGGGGQVVLVGVSLSSLSGDWAYQSFV